MTSYMIYATNYLMIRSEEDEYNVNLHKVSALLRYQCGLLFTNESKEAVIKYFSELADPDFARYITS